MRLGLNTKTNNPDRLDTVVKTNATMISVQARNEPVNRVSR
jgi:hypothetical protein